MFTLVKHLKKTRTFSMPLTGGTLFLVKFKRSAHLCNGIEMYCTGQDVRDLREDKVIGYIPNMLEYKQVADALMELFQKELSEI